jgi:glyoxylate reductase
MDIIYYNRNRVGADVEKELAAEYVPSLEALADQSDILSIHCPLTEATHHSVDQHILSTLGAESVLINTARGPIVDEAALAEALHSETIRAAGIDVFEHEPEVHPKLLSAPHCILEPHIVSATYHTRKAMGMLAADAISKILQGATDSEVDNLLAP